MSDRDELRAFYSRADAFLFPSTFDTNGLVVREAAACGCPSLLIAGSCAAEGIEEGVTGYLSEENASAYAKALERMLSDPEKMRQVGETPARKFIFPGKTPSAWRTPAMKAFAAIGSTLKDIMTKAGEKKRIRSSEGCFGILLSFPTLYYKDLDHIMPKIGMRIVKTAIAVFYVFSLTCCEITRASLFILPLPQSSACSPLFQTALRLHSTAA